MRDYIKRLLIAGIMALCISLLFLGGKETRAETHDIEKVTDHWVWPADGIITDTYGTRNGSHKGIDIAGGLGSPVYAVDEGYVSKSYYSDSYGHVVFLKHPNNLETVYAHLSKRNVQEGELVKKGDIIGEMGSTGDSSGSHLHFEVHKNEWTADKRNAVDPIIALGEVNQGESVQAMKREEKTGQVMTAATGMPVDEEPAETGYHHASTDKTDEQEQETDGTGSLPGVKVEKIIHHVLPGENLSVIAHQYHSTVKHIQEVNNIQTEKIFPEQELVIHPVNLFKYTVQPGDNLESIAKRTGVTVQHLMEENDLDSHIIHPDQELFYRLSR